MLFRGPELVQYLLEQGLLSRATVVRNGFELEPVGRRNHNFRVCTGGRDGVFVKQVQRPEPGAWHTLWREAVLYAQVDRSARLHSLRDLLPRVLSADGARGTVVTALVPESRTLLEVSGDDAQPSGVWFAHIGAALMMVHGAAHLLVLEPDLRPHLPSGIPWILELPLRPGVLTGSVSGPAAPLFLTLLGGFPALWSGLAATRLGWQADVVMHGDLRWDNVLLSGGAEDGRVVFADWELFDIGDSAWDVAALVRDWVLISHTRGLALAVAHDALTAMLHAYLRHRPSLAAAAWRRRVNAYVVAQLCASAFEFLMVRPDDAATALSILNRADVLLREPAELDLLLRGVRDD